MRAPWLREVTVRGTERGRVYGKAGVERAGRRPLQSLQAAPAGCTCLAIFQGVIATGPIVAYNVFLLTAPSRDARACRDTSGSNSLFISVRAFVSRTFHRRPRRRLVAVLPHPSSETSTSTDQRVPVEQHAGNARRTHHDRCDSLNSIRLQVAFTGLTSRTTAGAHPLLYGGSHHFLHPGVRGGAWWKLASPRRAWRGVVETRSAARVSSGLRSWGPCQEPRCGGAFCLPTRRAAWQADSAGWNHRSQP